VIGEPERGHPQLRRPGSQAIDLAGAVEQRVLAVDMEVDGAHALMISVAPDATGTTSRTVRGFRIVIVWLIGLVAPAQLRAIIACQ